MKKSLKKLTAMLTATAMVSCSMVSGVTLAAEIKSASRMLSPISQQGMINADVDFDGRVTAMDVNLIQKSVIGLVKFEVSADSGMLPGDVNLDGLVNIMDCVVLKNYLIYGGISDKYYSEDMVKFVPVRSEIAVSPSENSEFDAGYTIYSLNGGISGIKAKIDIDEDFDIYDVYSDDDFMWNKNNNEISMLYDKPINGVELYIGVKPYVDNGSYSLKLTDIEIIDAEGALISDANISAEPVNINFEEPVFMTTTTEPMVTTTTTTEPVWETTTTETTATTADTTFTTTLPSTTVTTDSSNDYINISFGDYVASPGSEVNVGVYIESFNNPVAGVDAAFELDSPLTLSRIGSSSPACNDASVMANVDENTACFTCLTGATPIVPDASEPLFILRVSVPAGCPDGIYSIGFDKCSVIRDGTSFEYNTRISNGSIMVVGESISYPPATTTTDIIMTTTTTAPAETDTTTTEPMASTTTTTEPIDYTTTSCPDYTVTGTTVSYYPDYTETETTTTEPIDYTTTTTSEEPIIPEASATTTAAPVHTTTTSDDINDGSTTTTTVEDTAIPEPSATTTTVPSDDLPQTGMPIARAVEGLAVLLTISGTALIVKSRRESDET